MKKYMINILMFLVMGLLLMPFAYSRKNYGEPVLRFTSLTETALSVSATGTETVAYQVTNQSRARHTWVMTSIPGISQMTGSGTCPNPFTLDYQKSCTLQLQISGGALVGNVVGGPTVCNRGNPNQCYKPNPAQRLNITTVGVVSSYSVGGTVSGLTGTVVLGQTDSGDSLTLTANGSFTFPTPVGGGTPYNVVVLNQPNNQTCTVNNSSNNIGNANVTNVMVSCSSGQYTLGGMVYGLQGSLVLFNEGNDNFTMNTDGSFTFPGSQTSGNTYSVTVQGPSGQTCTVNNGQGTITNTNVTNVVVVCSAHAYSVGGTILGLSGTVVMLQNNGQDTLTGNANGSFTFSTPVAQGATYNVTVSNQPPGQICTVNNGNGTMGTTNVLSVIVVCSANAFTVGGMVSGLTGTVVVRDNGGDTFSVNANGSFTFPTPVAQGATYNVSVLTQPSEQTCTVTHGSGTMGGTNVTQVGVNCVPNTTALNTSVSNLALSVTGLMEYGVKGTPSSGVARIITMTNTGTLPATGLSITFPIWPNGTISATTCGSSLAAGSSCSITVTPGNVATSDGSNPCSLLGTAPMPGVIQVAANNAATVSMNVVVLNYACIYEGGYVYAFDDTIPNRHSVGGAVASTFNQASPTINFGVIWSSSGTGSSSSNVIYNSIYGIAERSTSSNPLPSSPVFQGQKPCNGLTDGACNTNNIFVYYQNDAINHPINLAFYASGLCQQLGVGVYFNWYLPAICEMGYGGDCGNSSLPLTQNIQSNLTDNGRNLVLGDFFWSSTEQLFIDSGRTRAYAMGLTSGGSVLRDNLLKNSQIGVRCARALT